MHITLLVSAVYGLELFDEDLVFLVEQVFVEVLVVVVERFVDEHLVGSNELFFVIKAVIVALILEQVFDVFV